MTDFVQNELLVVQEVNKHNGDKTIIRVVIFGKTGTPILEKRLFYRSEGGEHKPGKRIGFNYEDFEVLIENQDKISNALAQKTAAVR